MIALEHNQTPTKIKSIKLSKNQIQNNSSHNDLLFQPLISLIFNPYKKINLII